jgi:hypothetical protein
MAAAMASLRRARREWLKSLQTKHQQLLIYLASCDARHIAYRYLPAALALGILAGVLVALASHLAALLVVLFGGMAIGVCIGYAIRSHISHRRRMRAMRR